MNTKVLAASLSQLPNIQLMAPVLGAEAPDQYGSFSCIVDKGLKYPLSEQRKLLLEALADTPDRKDGTPKQKAFPEFYGAGGFTLLEWLHRSGAWSGQKQSTFFQHVDPFRRTFKRELKTWSHALNKADFAGDNEGLMLMATLFLSVNDYRKTTRTDLNLQRRWILGPEGHFISAGMAWLGSELDASSINAMQTYYEDSPYDTFWSKVYWSMILSPSLEPELFSDIGQTLEACLSNVMRDLIPYAMRWSELSEKKRDGVLLVLYGLLLCYDCEAVAYPFAACHPEIGQRLGLRHACYEGLVHPNGTPNKLFAAAYNITWSTFDRCRNEPEAIFSMTNETVKELAYLVEDAEELQPDLQLVQRRQVSAHWHQWVVPFSNSLIAFSEEWPKDLKAAVQSILDNFGVWAELIDIESNLSRPDSALRADLAPHIDKRNQSPELQAFWRETYLAHQFSGDPDIEYFFSEDRFANDLEPGYSPEPLSALKAQAAQAIEHIDSTALTTISNAISAKVSFYNKCLARLQSSLSLKLHLEYAEENVYPQVAEIEADPVADDTAETAARLEPEIASQLATALKDRDLLQRDLSKVRQELYRAQQSALSLRAQLNQKTVPTLNVSSGLLSALTDNLSVMDALDAVAAVHPQVRLTDSALESGEQCTYQQPRKLLELLLRLAGPYYQAITVENQSDATARDILGSHYKAQESESTIANDKLRAQRQFDINGETVQCEQHLTLGVKRSPTLCMQVYFKILDGVLYITYAGAHLDTTTT